MIKKLFISMLTIVSLISYGQTAQLTDLKYSATGQPINGPIEVVAGQSVNINFRLNWNTVGVNNHIQTQVGIRWPESWFINSPIGAPFIFNPQSSGSEFFNNVNINSNNIPPGSKLTVLMYYLGGEIWGNAININIIPPPPPIQNNIITGNQNIVFGSTPSVLIGSTPTGGTGSYTYQWQAKTEISEWTDIYGGNSKNHQPAAPFLTTQYRRKVISPNTSSNISNNVIVTVLNSTNTIGSDQTINYGQIPDLLTGNDYCMTKDCDVTYEWIRRPHTPFPAVWIPVDGNSNSQNYQPPSLNSSFRYRRKLIVNGVSSYSNQIIIIVNNNLRTNLEDKDNIKNTLSPDIKLYPNPLFSDNFINLHIKNELFNNNEFVSLEILSLSGESLFKNNFIINNNEIKEKIELSGLDRGVYLFNFIINNKPYNYKVVKN